MTRVKAASTGVNLKPALTTEIVEEEVVDSDSENYLHRRVCARSVAQHYADDPLDPEIEKDDNESFLLPSDGDGADNDGDDAGNDGDGADNDGADNDGAGVALEN